MTDTLVSTNGSIRLGPTTEGDAAGIAEAGRDPAIRALPWFGAGFQDGWAEPWVRRAMDEWAAGRNRVFSIFDVDGRYLGSINASPPRDGAVEIAYWVLPSDRRRGVARQAVWSLLPWLRETFPDTLIWAKTKPDNEASQRVLAACGFVETKRAGTVRFEWRA
jgi:RimJ/RimL family protein N-acetyltransferase